ncbi:hypothetical protein C8Q79DRAFT_1004924 [Trametes meyenii]|nr:hypothetical protein C8Q79DRAFT_1004924 [Trametes meyenii]
MFARSVVAALVAAPFVAQVAFAASCTRQYTVKEGDWCDTISAANNVSTYQLAAVNSGTIDSTCNNLQVGQQICLGTEGEDCKTTHVVSADETCDGITGTYNINATVLYGNNPQIDSGCNNLYIGEVLCVANSIAAPVGSAIPVPPSSVTLVAATITPSATPSSTSAAPSATPTDDDEEDLPWCDEL